jgi:hypothetical protein
MMMMVMAVVAPFLAEIDRPQDYQQGDCRCRRSNDHHLAQQSAHAVC